MIDSHCHLDHEPLFDNIDSIIKRSKDTGLQKLLNISTTLESFDKIKNLVNLADTIDVSGALETNKVKDTIKIKKFTNEIKKISHAN
jgi:TatD DNase family protein